jgi:hypothetical protein
MRHQLRFVLPTLGMISSLVVVRTLPAQVALRVTYVQTNGVLDSVATCPGLIDDPEPSVVDRPGLGPVNIVSHAQVTNLICASNATAQASSSVFQTGPGTVQLSGSASVSTLASVLLDLPLPDDPFGASAADADLDITVGFEIAHWSQLGFAGTMTIGAVTAIGWPEHSSASLSQTWQLREEGGTLIAERTLQLASGEPQTTRQDTHYNSVLVGPGNYTLQFRVVGAAAADLRRFGSSGWTCSGSFGVALAATRTCAADWDRDGELDSRDFYEFLNGFYLEAADFNEDNVVDIRDLFDFVNAFLAGCE